MSASVRIIVDIDGNEVETNIANPLTTLARHNSHRQAAILLEQAVGQVARAHGLSYDVRISFPTDGEGA